MRNNKGFTLVEMLIVVAIIGTLIAIGMPTLTGSLRRAEQVTCEANRAIFVRSYKMNMVLDEGSYTLEQALDGEYPAMLQDLAGLRCPSGGTFTVEDGELVCSVHGKMGSGESGGSGGTGGGTGGGGTGGGSDTLAAGDTILGNVVLGSWESACAAAIASESQGIKLYEGKVYVCSSGAYAGKTYVVKSDNWDWLSAAAATSFPTNPGGVGFMQHFDPGAATINSSNYSSSTGWSPYLMNGTVFYENNMSFVYLGADNTQWEALPMIGGNWVQLVS